MVYENKQDWPEKYDIHKLVNREADIDKIINGDKTSVRRNDRYADPGDELTLKGKAFTIENVYAQKLKDVTDEIRSEERRVGKECRYRWAQRNEKTEIRTRKGDVR